MHINVGMQSGSSLCGQCNYMLKCMATPSAHPAVSLLLGLWSVIIKPQLSENTCWCWWCLSVNNGGNICKGKCPLSVHIAEMVFLVGKILLEIAGCAIRKIIIYHNSGIYSIICLPRLWSALLKSKSPEQFYVTHWWQNLTWPAH